MADLLPACVACAEARSDDGVPEPMAEEAGQLGKAVDSRRREFATGRFLARCAMTQLGLPPRPILRGPRREPLWPPGVMGSITHCQGYRAAALARTQDIRAVGIDAEVDAPLPRGVLDEVTLPTERAWLYDAPPGVNWDRALFSAKECVYKAWFPLTHSWLGFQDARVTLDPWAGTFLATLLSPPSGALKWAAAFVGRFRIRDGLVLSAIAVPR